MRGNQSVGLRTKDGVKPHSVSGLRIRRGNGLCVDVGTTAYAIQDTPTRRRLEVGGREADGSSLRAGKYTGVLLQPPTEYAEIHRASMPGSGTAAPDLSTGEKRLTTPSQLSDCQRLITR